MNGPVLLRLILGQGERWVIWQPGDLSADTLVCQAGRLAAFTYVPIMTGFTTN